jgi:SPX domain protein involved in polyphosphate accumulation
MSIYNTETDLNNFFHTGKNHSDKLYSYLFQEMDRKLGEVYMFYRNKIKELERRIVELEKEVTFKDIE